MKRGNMGNNLVKGLGAIGILVALGVGATAAWNMGAFDALVGRNTPEAIEARINEEMEGHPAFAASYTTLAEEFPDDHTNLKARMMEAYRERGQPLDAIAAGDRYFAIFMQRNGALFAKAPEARILEMRDAAIAVTEMLAVQDTRLCARFTMDGLGPTDQPTLEAQELIGAAARVKLQAMAAAIETPTEREGPTREDIDAYGEVLLNMGMSEAQVADFFNGAFGLRREPAQVQCEVGAIVHSALAALPDDRAARLGAILLSGRS